MKEKFFYTENHEGILHLHNVKFDPNGLSGSILINENEATVYGLVEIRN